MSKEYICYDCLNGQHKHCDSNNNQGCSCREQNHTQPAKEVLQDKHTQDEPCEVHKQRYSGIGNVGYGYAILKPLINKEGEYKGQRGGYHVIAHQDLRLTKEQADSICDSINSCYKL